MRRSLIEFRSKNSVSLLLCRLLSITTQYDNNCCSPGKPQWFSSSWFHVVGRTFEDSYSSQEANGRTEMLYTLSRLAPGSYDVLLDGVIIASLVRSGETNRATWTAELLMDVHPRRRPAPFTATEHTLGSLEEAQKWLGGAELQDTETQG